MAKKYTAEQARQLILDTSTRLFVEKGYEKTSIQDIVRELDGLSKGAVYHHFKSKDDIIEAVVRRFLLKEEELAEIVALPNKNGLEKIQELMFQIMFNSDLGGTRDLSFSLLENPKFFALYVLSNNEVMAPLIEKCLIEGNEDGSVNVSQPKQSAELSLLIVSTWFIPALFPNTVETFMDKLTAASTILEQAGMPILNEEMMTRLMNEIERKAAELNEQAKK